MLDSLGVFLSLLPDLVPNHPVIRHCIRVAKAKAFTTESSRHQAAPPATALLLASCRSHGTVTQEVSVTQEVPPSSFFARRSRSKTCPQSGESDLRRGTRPSLPPSPPPASHGRRPRCAAASRPPRCGKRRRHRGEKPPGGEATEETWKVSEVIGVMWMDGRDAKGEHPHRTDVGVHDSSCICMCMGRSPRERPTVVPPSRLGHPFELPPMPCTKRPESNQSATAVASNTWQP